MQLNKNPMQFSCNHRTAAPLFPHQRLRAGKLGSKGVGTDFSPACLVESGGKLLFERLDLHPQPIAVSLEPVDDVALLAQFD
jgi:hypothetical protein